MTNQQILHKVLKKVAWAINVKDNQYISYNHPFEIIFSHDFAKAFWGNDDLDNRGRTLIKAWEEEYRDSGLFMDFDEYASEPEIYYQSAWCYHLQKMIISSNPFQYLEKFLISDNKKQ